MVGPHFPSVQADTHDSTIKSHAPKMPASTPALMHTPGKRMVFFLVQTGSPSTGGKPTRCYGFGILINMHAAMCERSTEMD